MKRILITSLAILLIASAIQAYALTGAIQAVCGVNAAAASCAYQSGQSCTVSTDDTTGSSGTQYQGQGDYYPSSNMNVCQIDFWFVTVGAGNYTAYIFEMSGTSLGTEVCHSETKANTSITTGAWTSFAITGDCNIVTGGTTKYGVVVLNGNSVELGDKAVSGGCTTQGGLGVWNGDKAIADNYMGDYDELFRLYGK